MGGLTKGVDGIEVELRSRRQLQERGKKQSDYNRNHRQQYISENNNEGITKIDKVEGSKRGQGSGGKHGMREAKLDSTECNLLDDASR